MQTVPIRTDNTRAHRGSRTAVARRKEGTRFSSASDDEGRRLPRRDLQRAQRAIEHSSGQARVGNFCFHAVESKCVCEQCECGGGCLLANSGAVTLQ
jgi:hypothetical protein